MSLGEALSKLPGWEKILAAVAAAVLGGQGIVGGIYGSDIAADLEAVGAMEEKLAAIDDIEKKLDKALQWGGGARIQQLNTKIARWEDMLTKPPEVLEDVGTTRAEIRTWLTSAKAEHQRIMRGVMANE